MGQIKNIKLHIVTDIKIFTIIHNNYQVKMEQFLVRTFAIALLISYVQLLPASTRQDITVTASKNDAENDALFQKMLYECGKTETPGTPAVQQQPHSRSKTPTRQDITVTASKNDAENDALFQKMLYECGKTETPGTPAVQQQPHSG